MRIESLSRTQEPDVAQTLSTSLSIFTHIPQMTDDPSGGESAARPVSGAGEGRKQMPFVLSVYREMTLNMLL